MEANPSGRTASRALDERRHCESLGCVLGGGQQMVECCRSEWIGVLRSRMNHGRLPKLTAAQLCRIPSFSGMEPKPTDFVEMSGHATELLRFAAKNSEDSITPDMSPSVEAIGWTPQLPITRALQRGRTRHSGLARSGVLLKKQACSGAAEHCFLRTNRGFYLLPELSAPMLRWVTRSQRRSGRATTCPSWGHSLTVPIAFTRWSGTSPSTA